MSTASTLVSLPGYRSLLALDSGLQLTLWGNLPEFSAFPRVVSDPELGLDFMRVVHGSQEYELRRPIVLGETLEVTARIASIRRRGGIGFLVIETEMRGGDGAIAAVARSTMIEREPD